MKETCIYSELKRSIPDDASQMEAINGCISFFDERYGTRLFFCRIKGSRWGYIAGSKDLVANFGKFGINEHLGVCIEGNCPTGPLEIAESIKRLIDEVK